MTGIANQYALAVFSLAKEKGKELEYQKILEDFTNQVDEETEKFFAHPKVSREDKKTLLDNIITDTLLRDFVKVLVDNDRFNLLEAICLSYKDIISQMQKVMEVKVYSNKPLTKTNLDKIKNKLKATYQRNIEILELADNTIIGGFRIEFEGSVIDETINRQLEDLKSSLLD